MNGNSLPILRIPFALDDGERLSSPTEAEKGRGYFCPACHSPVILKKGAIRTPHFAHRVSEVCNQETITHKTAKLIVQKAVQDWKLGNRKAPELQRRCEICGKYNSQPLPQEIDSAVLEYKLPDGSIVDVALMSGGVAKYAIEIRVTHAVEEIKAGRISVPFVELIGDDLVETPSIWVPRIDQFDPIICDKCESNYSAFQTKAEQIAKANNLELPKAYYRYGLWKCWNCNREMIVFSWPQHTMWGVVAPKVKPCPQTIRYEYGKTVRHKYWTNTCPYCKQVQGDNYLYRFPNGPFPMDIEEDSPAAFNRDMMMIAHHITHLGLNMSPAS